MNKKFLLDHGYVEIVESWGRDEDFIKAARMSTNKGFQGWGEGGKVGDEKLLRYLYVNQHATPFEMGGAIFEIQAPIFVFREWHRHRTQSYNELSGRYTAIPNENYIPTFERCLAGLQTNKQSARNAPVDEAAIDNWLLQLHDEYARQERFYQAGLAAGVPKELARIVVPVGRYSRMRASANLRNWLGFLRLRNSDKAQHEIRLYAEAVQMFLTEIFPRTMALFEEEQNAR